MRVAEEVTDAMAPKKAPPEEAAPKEEASSGKRPSRYGWLVLLFAALGVLAYLFFRWFIG